MPSVLAPAGRLAPRRMYSRQATIGGWDAKDPLAARGGRRAPPARAAECGVPPAGLRFLEATEISSAKVCGAGECREVSDPEAATALAVGPRPRGTDAPARGLPWYKGTLTIRAEDGGEVSTDRVSVIVVPSAGLMPV